MTVDAPQNVGTAPAEEIEPILRVRSEPGVTKPDPILTVEGVHRTFGGLVAVDIDHLEVQRGVVTSLIGPNGAGKTTLFNLLSGFERADRGRWTFAGQLVSGMSADRLARRGMVRTFQLTKPLARLPVIENMLLGAADQSGERLWVAPVRSRWLDEERANTERAEQLLEQFNLAHMRDELAGTLSGGQCKLLEVARALMTEPKLIMLDEPMAGVNPALAQSLMQHLSQLAMSGVSVVFIEHDMNVVAGISDWVVVLAEGRVIAEGPPWNVIHNDLVIDAYLGRSAGQAESTEREGPS
ncbi:MAG: ABC transporter ATP-binding protein [Acidimicrobiaceae bacterium]|nr:ABC transporter ATP-binding protein [Acidimicrobiaceae bacterium]MXW76558.1 ABC transporter ATP-binding protein [Acidimicrobiaceae bacterium]MYC42850.1 ABC transporter ATP-binding protein [Acidimicrobiaceae bacterium]MYD08351.1 ABC transporter ATP-binding protein [Acidimicrobiaceae bacterium]MYH88969.1 ABC transporter ATP-binding protein [Acidimicrobiaceae bacterium]